MRNLLKDLPLLLQKSQPSSQSYPRDQWVATFVSSMQEEQVFLKLIQISPCVKPLLLWPKFGTPCLPIRKSSMTRSHKKTKKDSIGKQKSSNLKATSSTKMVRIAKICGSKRKEARMQSNLKRHFQLTCTLRHKITKK